MSKKITKKDLDTALAQEITSGGATAELIELVEGLEENNLHIYEQMEVVTQDVRNLADIIPEGLPETLTSLEGTVAELDEAMDTKFTSSRIGYEGMDLDELWLEGKYAIGPNAEHGPTDETLTNLVVYVAEEWVTQIGYTAEGVAFTRSGMYLRSGTSINGVAWGDWMAQGGSGGSGSGKEKFFDLKIFKDVSIMNQLRIDTTGYKDVVIKFNQVSRRSQASDRTQYVVSCMLGTTGGTNQHVRRAVNSTAWSASENSGSQINLFTVKAPPTGYDSMKWSGEVEIDTLSFRYSMYSLFYNTGIYQSGYTPDGLQIENVTETYGGRNVTSETSFNDGDPNDRLDKVIPLNFVTFSFGTGSGIGRGHIEAWGTKI